MKQIVFITLVLILTACGGDGQGVRFTATPQPTNTPKNGSNGSDGANGTNGKDGISTVVSIAQATALECPTGGQEIQVNGMVAAVVCNGSNGSQGIAGLDGTNGTNGSNGTNGVDGINGTVVIPVQFCTGFTASYPNVFPESGLIIGGKMYGVYSANGGFLVFMPPGTYSSNGINASCTFTLNADNSITY